MSDAFGEDLFNVFDQNTETHVTPTDKTSSSRSDEKRSFVNFIYVFWNPFHFVPLNHWSLKIYHINLIMYCMVYIGIGSVRPNYTFALSSFCLKYLNEHNKCIVIEIKEVTIGIYRKVLIKK